MIKIELQCKVYYCKVNNMSSIHLQSHMTANIIMQQSDELSVPVL